MRPLHGAEPPGGGMLEHLGHLDNTVALYEAIAAESRQHGAYTHHLAIAHRRRDGVRRGRDSGRSTCGDLLQVADVDRGRGGAAGRDLLLDAVPLAIVEEAIGG